jgi:hypothetical protein
LPTVSNRLVIVAIRGRYLVSIQKWLFSPISALGRIFNPRNINHMPAVKIYARLELDETISFLDGHYLRIVMRTASIEPIFTIVAFWSTTY